MTFKHDCNENNQSSMLYLKLVYLKSVISVFNLNKHTRILDVA